MAKYLHYLPEDIIHDILSRLPVKSLLRFRCVSKTWCALIDSPTFAKSHLKKSTITKSMMCNFSEDYAELLKFVCDETSGDIVLEEIKYPFSSKILGSCNGLLFEELEYPFSSKIMGSCNGLLLSFNDDFSEALLFNPSTRNFCKIPNIEETYDFYRHLIWGFGYDEMSGDYKVVRIDRLREEVSGWIYSLKSASWRRLAHIPNYAFCELPYCEAYLNNAVHWLLLNCSSGSTFPRSIAALDMGTEEFHLIPLPKYNHNSICIPDLSDDFYLHVLDECLCFCWVPCEDDFIEFWIMREYRASECNWAKLMKVDIHCDWCIWVAKPIAFSENSKLLLVHVIESELTETLAWYDIKTGLLKRKFDNLPRPLGVPHSFIHSLINPNPDRLYTKKLDEIGATGEIPDDLALEVSSPGADRLLRVPDELLRFKNMPMAISYLEESNGRCTEKNGVYFLDCIETGASM